MSGQALRLVDEHGVVSDESEIVESLKAQIKDLQGELTKKLGEITKLKKDRVRERLEHKRRPDVMSIWAEWQVECKHPRSGLTNDRFDAILGLLEARNVQGSEDDGSCMGCGSFVYDRDHFSRAIAGAKFDPFITRHKNGRPQRHDDIKKICEGGKSFESFCNRAPKGWVPPVEYPVAPAPRAVPE